MVITFTDENISSGGSSAYTPTGLSASSTQYGGDFITPPDNSTYFSFIDFDITSEQDFLVSIDLSLFADFEYPGSPVHYSVFKLRPQGGSNEDLIIGAGAADCNCTYLLDPGWTDVVNFGGTISFDRVVTLAPGSYEIRTFMTASAFRMSGSFDYSFTAIPLPGTLGLFASTLLGLGGIKIRRWLHCT